MRFEYRKKTNNRNNKQFKTYDNENNKRKRTLGSLHRSNGYFNFSHSVIIMEHTYIINQINPKG